MLSSRVRTNAPMPLPLLPWAHRTHHVRGCHEAGEVRRFLKGPGQSQQDFQYCRASPRWRWSKNLRGRDCHGFFAQSTSVERQQTVRRSLVFQSVGQAPLARGREQAVPTDPGIWPFLPPQLKFASCFSRPPRNHQRVDIAIKPNRIDEAMTLIDFLLLAAEIEFGQKRVFLP